MTQPLNWVTEIKRYSAVLAMHTSCYGMNKYVPYLFGIPFTYNNVLYMDSCLYKVKEEDDVLKSLLQEAFEKDQDYFLNVTRRIRTDGSIISSFARRSLTNQAVSNTEQKELPRLFGSYISMMTHFGTYYRFMEPSTFILETKMVEMLKEKIQDRLEVQQALLILGVSHEHDYVTAERRSLLAIAAEADRKMGSNSRRSLPTEEYVERLKNDPELLRVLEQHVQSYSWMGSTGYRGSSYTVDQYASFIHDIDIDDIGLELQILKYQDEQRIEQARTLVQKLKLSPMEEKLVQSIRECDYINGLIKEIVTSTRQRADYLMTRISRILDVDVKKLVNLTFEEILTYLKKAIPLDANMCRIAEERSIDWAMLISSSSIKIYSGDQLKNFKSSFQKPDYSHLIEVKGTPANLGKITAPAKIINSTKDFPKIQRGDILIASMTTPEYSAVMDRISGIITDEGGVTSHAGSIAREKGIPCLSGTRIATKIFSDDDQIELNANIGIARKINVCC